MSHPWFFAPPSEWSERNVLLPPDETHHAVKVMRIEPPALVVVTNGRGTVATAAAAELDGTRLRLDILEREERRPPVPEVVVYQAAAKGHKLDEVVERLAALGVVEVAAFEARRSVAHWDAGKVEKLTTRWEQIARSAAKQSRNPFVMRTAAGLSWTEVVRRITKEPLALVLWEKAAVPLRVVLPRDARRLALVIGPEGGLEEREVEELADAGAPSVSLGPQILRTEDAPVVASTAVLFNYGALG